MYQVVTSAQYRRAFKKLSKSGNFPRKEFDLVVDILREGKSLALKYRDHKLTGEFKDYRECHVRPDLLLIYQIRNKELVLVLIDIGSHSYLFN
jgi:mRNA interferase YafQ